MYRPHLRARASQALTAPLDSELVMSTTSLLKGDLLKTLAKPKRDVIPFTVIRTDGTTNLPMTREQQLDAIDSYLDGGEWFKVSVRVDGWKSYDLHFDMSTITEDDAIILIEEEMEAETLRKLVDKCRGGIWCARTYEITIEELFGDADEDEGDAAWYLEEFFGES